MKNPLASGLIAHYPIAAYRIGTLFEPATNITFHVFVDDAELPWADTLCYATDPDSSDWAPCGTNLMDMHGDPHFSFLPSKAAIS